MIETPYEGREVMFENRTSTHAEFRARTVYS